MPPGRGMLPDGPGGMRMPPNVRPPGVGGWGDAGGGGIADRSNTSGWGMGPSSPPGGLGGNAPNWGQKPKSGLGWGDPSDMMDPSGGWGGHKPVSLPLLSRMRMVDMLTIALHVFQA